MDQKFFRQETSGHVVVMGRKTLESFPGGLPLKNRTNIVLTRKENYDGHGAIVVHTEEALLEELKKYEDDDIYVVGGGQIYEMLLPYCNLIHVTKIDFSYEADTYFPNLDEMPEWEVTAESEEPVSYTHLASSVSALSFYCTGSGDHGFDDQCETDSDLFHRSSAHRCSDLYYCKSYDSSVQKSAEQDGSGGASHPRKLRRCQSCARFFPAGGGDGGIQAGE